MNAKYLVILSLDFELIDVLHKQGFKRGTNGITYTTVLPAVLCKEIPRFIAASEKFKNGWVLVVEYSPDTNVESYRFIIA